MFEGSFSWSSVAETAAWAVVHKIFDTPQFLRGHRSEVDSFGEELPKETVGVFVRTTVVRTTRLGKVETDAMRLLHKVAASELTAVVERERPPLRVGKFCERLSDLLMHMARRLVVDTFQTRKRERRSTSVSSPPLPGRPSTKSPSQSPSRPRRSLIAGRSWSGLAPCFVGFRG